MDAVFGSRGMIKNNSWLEAQWCPACVRPCMFDSHLHNKIKVDGKIKEAKV